MESIAKKILVSEDYKNKEVILPREFLHLGSRASVDKAFSRLVEEEKLLRVGRGIYFPAVISEFGICCPYGSEILASLGKKTGKTYVTHPVVDANRLGLTTQNQVREIWLGPDATFMLHSGKHQIEVRKGKHYLLVFGMTQAGSVVRSIEWLGRMNIDKHITHLKNITTANVWQELYDKRAILPSWIGKCIQELKSGA